MSDRDLPGVGCQLLFLGAPAHAEPGRGGPGQNQHLVFQPIGLSVRPRGDVDPPVSMRKSPETRFLVRNIESFGIRAGRILCLGGVAGSEPIFPLHEWCRIPVFAHVTEITVVAPWHLAIQAIFVHNVWVSEPFYHVSGRDLQSSNTVDRFGRHLVLI